MASLKKETLLEWYRQMVLIRLFETRCDELYHDKKITGVYLHLYSGHEAVGVGALSTLKPTDHVITAYRDHGIALARGLDPKPVMAEMMGKKTGVAYPGEIEMVLLPPIETAGLTEKEDLMELLQKTRTAIAEELWQEK